MVVVSDTIEHRAVAQAGARDAVEQTRCPAGQVIVRRKDQDLPHLADPAHLAFLAFRVSFLELIK